MKFFAALAALTWWPLTSHAAEVDAGQLSAWWGIPFAGMLLCIAVLPLATPQLWHHHFEIGRAHV